MLSVTASRNISQALPHASIELIAWQSIFVKRHIYNADLHNDMILAVKWSQTEALTPTSESRAATTRPVGRTFDAEQGQQLRYLPESNADISAVTLRNS